ncbi:FMN-binding protein [Nocardiopsis valliformis]|uniref:FMN-binding protein n=1 Tax=Nocardiopsis valliformis TaxID=239974 RepID=UPI00034C240A|nr:FMN-binding protein [Nocardiopsis valliformis]
MRNTPGRQARDGLVRAGLAAAGVGLVLGVAHLQNADAPAEAAEPGPEPTRFPSPDPSEEPEQVFYGDYNDGEYTAPGSYIAHGAPNELTVTVTLEDNAVAGVEVVGAAESGNSKRFQEQFAEKIPELVVGVPLDEIEVGKVSGSSLTGDGFMEALNQIRDDAKL